MESPSNAPVPDPSRSGPKIKRSRPLLSKSVLRPRPGGSAKTPGETGGSQPALVSLSWADQDIENRWGIFKGGRYTNVNKLLCFLLAAAITTVFSR